MVASGEFIQSFRNLITLLHAGSDSYVPYDFRQLSLMPFRIRMNMNRRVS